MDRSANNGRSRVSRALVKKAMDIAEAEKVYRIASTDNILTCMVVEGIQSREYRFNIGKRSLIFYLDSKADPDRG